MPDVALLPWRVNSSDRALSTPWFTIVKYSCETPAGRIVPAYYVHEAPDSVMCVCITADGEVVVERQYRFPLRKISMDYPAGTVQSNETLEHAAVRELFEETGYVGDDFVHLFSLAKDPGFSASQMHVFAVKNGYRKTEMKDPDESVVIDLLQPHQLLEAIEQGQMSCSFCVATTLRAARILNWSV